jgi:APA family basic amino acid/polyamine antiporter
VAGSAYTFSYASLDEFMAWITGWGLILELTPGASTVAVGWSSYFADVMKSAGVTIPAWAYGGGHNIIAAAIVLILTPVICLGIKISAQVNWLIVAVKIGIVLFVIVAGCFYTKASNYSPFIPPASSPGAGGAQSTPSLLQDLGVSPDSFGMTGIFTGAAPVFFALTSWQPPRRRPRNRSGICLSASVCLRGRLSRCAARGAASCYGHVSSKPQARFPMT